jgi:hypothetical protein
LESIQEDTIKPTESATEINPVADFNASNNSNSIEVRDDFVELKPQKTIEIPEFKPEEPEKPVIILPVDSSAIIEPIKELENKTDPIAAFKSQTLEQESKIEQATVVQQENIKVEKIDAPELTQLPNLSKKDTVDVVDKPTKLKPKEENNNDEEEEDKPNQKKLEQRHYQKLDYSHDDLDRRAAKQLAMAQAGMMTTAVNNQPAYPQQFNPQMGGMPQNYGYNPMSQQMGMGVNPNMPYGNNFNGGMNNPDYIMGPNGQYIYNQKFGRNVTIEPQKKILDDIRMIWLTVVISSVVVVWLSIYIFIMVGQLFFDKTIELPPELSSDLSNLVTFIMGGLLAYITKQAPVNVTTEEGEDVNNNTEPKNKK